MISWSRIVRKLKQKWNGWWFISLIGAAVILLPILFIIGTLFTKANENWAHIRAYLLKDYVADSLSLVVLTGFFAAALGMSLAWLVTACDFPGRKVFRWALVLPLAIPPYIAAYTYSTMLSYTGIVQATLRNRFKITIDPAFISFTSMKAAVFTFTLFLFPYVYLIARSFLESQSASFIESARLLGRSPWAVFFRVALPLSRPALVGGAVLVVFEVLSDYAVTSYFGLYTITTAIFQTWFGLYDVDTAMRLAAWLMLIVIGLFFLERLLRLRRSYSLSVRSRPLAPIRLKGAGAACAFAFCFVVLSLGFLIPVVQLAAWAGLTFESVWKPSFVRLVLQTLYAAAIPTLLIAAAALAAANTARSRTWISFVLSKWLTAGYSIPGAIIAIGVLAFFLWLDERLLPLYAALGLGEDTLVLSLSLVMLITGYFIRFMAIGFNAVEAGYERIGVKYSEASRLLGHGAASTFFRIELPLLKGAVLSGVLLTFVEICKELPLSLLLRPFNFETLATKVYQYAGDEQIHEASIPSLIIIGISMLSVLMLHYSKRKVER
jgi:iron(III) transport system permease protein